MTRESALVRIRAAHTVIAWDATRGGHVYRRNCDVVFDATGVLHLGKDYQGAAPTRDIDGARLLVMPGLISTHTHLGSGAYSTGFLEEVSDPQFQHSPLYTRKRPFWSSDVASPAAPGARGFTASLQRGIHELLASGVTTVVDIEGVMDDATAWIETLAASGMRAYLAPSFQEAQWRTPDALRLEYAWDPAGGRRQFEQAQAIIRAARAHSSDRLQAMVFAAQVDTCGAALLRDAKALADSQGLTFQTHAAQSVPEVREMLGRHGLTPVAWLDSLGVLDNHTVLGHAIFLDHHSQVRHHTRSDLACLAERGVSVAHCPVTFSRWGVGLEDLGRYEAAGVNLSMGNDTGPQNMLEEMRTAFTVGRLLADTPTDITMAGLFNAATIGGAAALGRSDLGRVCVGAQADLVLVDLDHPRMQPHHDPLRALLFVAAERAVREVHVGGQCVYAEGRPLGFDPGPASDLLQPGLAAMLADVTALPGRPRLDEIAALSFPLLD